VEITEECLITRHLEIILRVWLVDGRVSSLHINSLGRRLLDAKEEIFIAHSPDR
jgi:hypothetical protein